MSTAKTVSRSDTHDLPEREGDRKLTWGELIALAVSWKGYYTAPMVDLNHAGQRGDFFAMCLNNRFPMYESELTGRQRELVENFKTTRSTKAKESKMNVKFSSPTPATQEAIARVTAYAVGQFFPRAPAEVADALKTAVVDSLCAGSAQMPEKARAMQAAAQAAAELYGSGTPEERLENKAKFLQHVLRTCTKYVMFDGAGLTPEQIDQIPNPPAELLPR